MQVALACGVGVGVNDGAVGVLLAVAVGCAVGGSEVPEGVIVDVGVAAGRVAVAVAVHVGCPPAALMPATLSISASLSGAMLNPKCSFSGSMK